jgi:hypothetical protein
MDWEEFDNLPTEAVEEDVFSTSAGLTIASGYKMNKPKMMPKNDHQITKSKLKKSDKSKATKKKHSKPPSKNLMFDYRPYDYYDEHDDVPVSVVYEEIDTYEEKLLKNELRGKRVKKYEFVEDRK